MNDREFELLLERLLKRDYSVGTEAFRDALLARCLEVLGSSEKGDASDCRVAELSDSDLDLLAAAGDLYSNPPER